ncbi:MAG TPA: META domain-containing protein [Flavitalea sp.]|nr:META domain-containing protein [Flavitalea sp.]
MKDLMAFLIVPVLLVQCSSQQQQNISNAPLTLENTYWKLVEVGGIAVTTPLNGHEVFMVLAREQDAGVLKGHAGCNGLGGNYQVEGDKIKFQAITTRMFCESRMEVENLFTRMLTAADNYRIRENTLELLSGNETLGKFDGILQK